MADKKRPTFWIVLHTHWEGAVFKTREDYLDMGLPIILQALRLLRLHPDYRFTLDQASYVEPFLERYPEEEAYFRQALAEGRLQIAGGTDVMLDVNMPGGESFVRQVLYGKSYFRRKLGIDVRVGWQLDTFGHHAQMPQLLCLGGFDSFWFFRGVPTWDTPSEFRWEGLDGSQIPAFWLSQGYALTYGTPATGPEFAQSMEQRFHSLDRQARLEDRVGLGGADVSEPEEHLPLLVEQYNQNPDRPIDLRFGTPAEYEEAVGSPAAWPVLRGELNPIFQGAYSSRIELKQSQRELEVRLAQAEVLDALGQWLGGTTQQERTWQAWEPVLFNQTHDLASGVMTDYVYQDTLASYSFSRRLADGLVSSGIEAMTDRIDTRGEGVPLVVWNPLGWERTDVAEVQVGFSQPDVMGLDLTDHEGQAVPIQLVEASRYPGGGLRNARIAFPAQVPALGHAVYHLVPRDWEQSAAGPASAGAVLETGDYRVEVDPATGAINRMLVKAGSWEALSGRGNVVTCQHDGGDLWEPYQPLDGGSRIAMTRQQPLPRPGHEQVSFSDQFRGEPGATVVGPVFSQLSVEHPFGPEGRFATTIRLAAGVPRVDIRTRILNQQKFVRYQALFPTSISQGECVHEIPFGAAVRPLGIEFPTQSWAAYGDGKHGLALLNRGLPGNLVTEDALLLSLMRSTCIVAYGFGGGYEPGMSSDTGFELGQERCFEYAVVGYQGDWRAAQLYRRGWEFNHPLIVRKAVPHAGALPPRWGWMEVSAPNVVVSALKPGPDGTTILRVYEAEGRSTPQVSVACQGRVASAEETDLLEGPGHALAVAKNAVRFDLRGFEIKTIRLRLQGPS